MTIRLECPQCRTSLELPDAPPPGKSVRCPTCNAVFTPAADLVALEEDEGEDQPRRKKKKKKRAGTPIWLQIVGAAICLTIIGFCIAIVVIKRTPDDKDKEPERIERPRRVIN